MQSRNRSREKLRKNKQDMSCRYEQHIRNKRAITQNRDQKYISGHWMDTRKKKTETSQFEEIWSWWKEKDLLIFVAINFRNQNPQRTDKLKASHLFAQDLNPHHRVRSVRPGLHHTFRFSCRRMKRGPSSSWLKFCSWAEKKEKNASFLHYQTK